MPVEKTYTDNLDIIKKAKELGDKNSKELIKSALEDIHKKYGFAAANKAIANLELKELGFKDYKS